MSTSNDYRRTGRRGSAPVESAARVRAAFEGEPLEGPAGASVAAALVAAGRPAWRVTREGAPRGLFCGIGVCFDCIVEIDGESGQRACMIPLREGMDIRRDPGSGASSRRASIDDAAASAAANPTSTDGSET